MESIKGYDQWKLQSDEEARHEARPASNTGSKQPDLLRPLTKEEQEWRNRYLNRERDGADYE